MNSDIAICPECGFEYKHFLNLYGKVCTRCHCILKSDFEMKCVKDNKEKKEELLKQALEQIKKNIGDK